MSYYLLIVDLKYLTISSLAVDIGSLNSTLVALDPVLDLNLKDLVPGKRERRYGPRWKDHLRERPLISPR